MWPVNMAQNTARQKKNMDTAVWARNHQATRPGMAAPATAWAHRVMRAMARSGARKKARPDSQLVRNSPSRRMGRAWSIPVERLFIR